MSGITELLAMKLGILCLGACCGACSCAGVKDLYKATHEGLLLPKGCLKTSVKNNLTSDTILFVDLDAEYSQVKDMDNAKLDSSSSLFLTRMYNDINKIVDEISEMNEVSNKLKTIVFISSDYKLLKFCGCNSSGIDYMIPTDSLHTELMKNDGWNEVEYQKLRTDLLARKSSKIQTFSNLQDLLSQIIAIYPEAKIKV